MSSHDAADLHPRLPVRSLISSIISGSSTRLLVVATCLLIVVVCLLMVAVCLLIVAACLLIVAACLLIVEGISGRVKWFTTVW
jgi:hypothetical protein